MSRIIPRGPSQPFPPNGLWSLWDMLHAYGFLFVHAIDQIDEVCDVARRDPNGTWKKNITTGTMAGAVFDVLLDTISYLAKETGMRSVEDQLRRIKQWTEILELPLNQLAGEFFQLKVRIEDELRRKDFLFISEEMTELYNKSDPRRGAVKGTDPFELGDKFKEAHADIASAGRCLAVGEGTACVLHLDRAMEIVLRKLATKPLKVVIGPRDTWGAILNKMTPEIAKMPERNQQQKTKKQAWSEARTHLFHVKECWRDRPAHGLETYTPARAKEIFEAVRVFMTHLAAL
jgi:hypothetical protein